MKEIYEIHRHLELTVTQPETVATRKPEKRGVIWEARKAIVRRLGR